MPPGRPKVTVTRKLPDSVEQRLSALFDTVLNETDRPMSAAQLIEAARVSDVLAPTLGDRLDAAFFEAAGDRLKLIANFGAGIDHIDIDAAIAHGVTVTNTPSVLAEDAADMAMALILAVPRRLVEGVRALEDGKFSGWSPTWMLGRRIWGKRLGIVGMGRIGTAVARRARAFGLSIHYHNRSRVSEQVEQELDATYWESLDQMLSRVDVVSVNCPHTPATFHLLSARRIALMQPGSIIVNTARGEIIDQDALVRALQEDRLAGAGLDVLEHEPAVSEDLMALSRQGKAVILPHMGSATIEGRQEMGERVIINIRTWMDGHRPPDRILASMV